MERNILNKGIMKKYIKPQCVIESLLVEHHLMACSCVYDEVGGEQLSNEESLYNVWLDT